MLTPEKIAELKAEHAGVELRRVRTKAGEVVLRTPRLGDWRRMQDESTDPKRRAEASRALVRASVVYPPPVEFLAMLERRPGITETLLQIALEMGGVEEAAQGEEL